VDSLPPVFTGPPCSVDTPPAKHRRLNAVPKFSTPSESNASDATTISVDRKIEGSGAMILCYSITPFMHTHTHRRMPVCGMRPLCSFIIHLHRQMCVAVPGRMNVFRPVCNGARIRKSRAEISRNQVPLLIASRSGGPFPEVLPVLSGIRASEISFPITTFCSTINLQ
jgi:hypothetical protein